MKRENLEHIIRAAAAITNQKELVVIGSQSILGAFPEAPAELLESREVDIYPLDRPDLADVIDGAIGERSPFDDTFGYHAHGIGPETATLPVGWQQRVVKVQNANTDGKIGYCLDATDLAASKLVANRDKDRSFVAVMLRHGMIDRAKLAGRMAQLPISDDDKSRLLAGLQNLQ